MSRCLYRSKKTEGKRIKGDQIENKGRWLSLGTYSEDQKREGSETNHKWMKLRGLKELHSSALTKEEQEDGRTKRKKQITRGRWETQQCVPKSQIDVCAVKMSGGQKEQNESDRGVTSRVGTADAIRS
jgi:predicted HNH restriction endonuclease